LEKFQEAESAFEAAVELRPQLEEKAFIKEQYRELLISRATNLTVLGKLTEAVAAYDEARAADDDALDSVYLDEMLLVYNDSNDPDGLKGLDIIKSWTNEERLALFDYYMELADSDSIIRIFKAGKTAGELDLLLGWIEDFKRSSSVKPESAGMFFYQKTLADIHYRIMNDPAAAKEIYTTALNMDIKIFGSGLIPDRLGARVSLAGIVFDEFRQSTDPQRKVELYQTLKTHLLKADNDVQDTNAVVSLALMARTVGSPLEFQSFLERGFNHCYENLTDTTGWNDQPSFRLLARILACVPGLERDALIAYSCQFYEVDKNLKGWKEDDSESDDSEAYVDEYFLYSQPSVNSGLQTTAPKHASDATNGSGAAVSEKITTSVAVSSTQESVVSADTAKTLVILHKEVEVEVKTTITESGPAAKPYDLSPYAWVICNGRCEGTHNQKRYKNWDDPVYLCIICPNCDLCADCHSKRLEMSTGEGTYWRDYCGRDHCYLKGPMEGWCGVRDGVVHVGGDAFAFKAWIEGLRSVRWKLAWDEFWLGRGYIKDL
jgi:tetratricopeptide (TPR) repeat protein